MIKTNWLHDKNRNKKKYPSRTYTKKNSYNQNYQLQSYLERRSKSGWIALMQNQVS